MFNVFSLFLRSFFIVQDTLRDFSDDAKPEKEPWKIDVSNVNNGTKRLTKYHIIINFDWALLFLLKFEGVLVGNKSFGKLKTGL